MLFYASGFEHQVEDRANQATEYQFEHWEDKTKLMYVLWDHLSLSLQSLSRGLFIHARRPSMDKNTLLPATHLRNILVHPGLVRLLGDIARLR